MVLNLCSPHFQTSIQCNKLCADGYDASNLLSADPIARRRGFKLEYFLRPPVHVTLSFQVKMELCRLDVELWPWGMDQGRTSRRLEILTCSERDGDRFELVSRCDLQEELQVCFLNPAFKPREPFSDALPQTSSEAKTQELWRRGSLGSVAQLRVSIPYSGAASALGIKSLAVWALPSRCCHASELEKIWDAHLKSLQKSNHSTIVPPKSDPVPTEIPIPEEFLDPLTQELMVFPMILPSGMVIDNSTLEEYQKREATWGRLPNDPFTGVPFTQNSKPIPNPLLKSRIDRLALQTGCTGVRTRNNLLTKPQPSRLAVEARDVTDSSRNRDQTDSSQSFASVSDSKTRADSCKSGPMQSRSAKRKYESSFPSTSADPDRSILRKAHETPSEPDSHERRLADSLDQALNAALHGLPVFTSPSKTSSSVDSSSGLQSCAFCSCSLTVYSSSVASYSLPCAHLMCGACLRQKRTSDPQRLKIECPACGTTASSRDVTRVHH
ncbi:RING finger protein 37 [Onychostoma macrolepis]|nr:RING finger protein 37 [Onychostoma macrolepis]XP_058641621.1 RING finger protein 37 [Onychostoma macrolepis]XP_058641622.1 RING finger protein 37 [Onychostoma macrolepis]XP_058641623.1 RING finger protein 37 [Onychostoma macrolepis]XP_058641624.1 RING finger protein 37 [Onychostoma macrolepis]